MDFEDRIVSGKLVTDLREPRIQLKLESGKIAYLGRNRHNFQVMEKKNVLLKRIGYTDPQYELACSLMREKQDYLKSRRHIIK